MTFGILDCDTVIQSFNRDGFVFVRSSMDPTKIDVLTVAVESALSGPGAHAHRGAAFALRRAEVHVDGVRALAVGPVLGAIARVLIGEAARPVRALVFDKRPGANWDLPWHRDETIAVQERLDVTPEGFGPWSVKDGVVHLRAARSVLDQMVSLRLHLDDCDASQGALRVLAGSHRNEDPSTDSTREVICEARRGDVLAMRPRLLHASTAAESPSHRRVIHIEYAAEALPGGLHWLDW